MMKADNRHRERFAGTIASGNDCREVLWPESVICTIGACTPPSDLSRVALNTEPARSKELDVTAAASQIDSGFSTWSIHLDLLFWYLTLFKAYGLGAYVDTLLNALNDDSDSALFPKFLHLRPEYPSVGKTYIGKFVFACGVNGSVEKEASSASSLCSLIIFALLLAL
jgi:hypothetical protein